MGSSGRRETGGILFIKRKHGTGIETEECTFKVSNLNVHASEFCPGEVFGGCVRYGDLCEFQRDFKAFLHLLDL